jgi:hypothetical protein
MQPAMTNPMSEASRLFMAEGDKRSRFIGFFYVCNRLSKMDNTPNDFMTFYQLPPLTTRRIGPIIAKYRILRHVFYK